MNQADILDRALEDAGRPDQVPASIRSLVTLASEVADALTAVRLSPGEQQRLYVRSLAMLENALNEHRRGWQRVLHLQRPAPAIVGGAALTIGAAAIGWAVLHGRRGASRAMAA